MVSCSQSEKSEFSLQKKTLVPKAPPLWTLISASNFHFSKAACQCMEWHNPMITHESLELKPNVTVLACLLSGHPHLTWDGHTWTRSLISMNNQSGTPCQPISPNKLAKYYWTVVLCYAWPTLIACGRHVVSSVWKFRTMERDFLIMWFTCFVTKSFILWRRVSTIVGSTTSMYYGIALVRWVVFP